MKATLLDKITMRQGFDVPRYNAETSKDFSVKNIQKSKDSGFYQIAHIPHLHQIATRILIKYRHNSVQKCLFEISQSLFTPRSGKMVSIHIYS